MYKVFFGFIPEVWSLRRVLVLWWGFFLAIQQAERFFLMQEAWSLEAPTKWLLLKTLWTGFRADLISATSSVLIAAIGGTVIGCGLWVLSRFRNGRDTFTAWLRVGFIAAAWLMAVIVMLCLTIDMGYYNFNKQHLDFVFFEYVGDLITQANEIGLGGAQAAQQTNAEIREGGRWGPRLAAFFLLEMLAVSTWWILFTRVMTPLLNSRSIASPSFANAALLVGITFGISGFHPKGPEAIRTVAISSATYYTLAQNPILYAVEGLRATINSQWKEGARLKEGRGLDNDWEALPQLPGKVSLQDLPSALHPMKPEEALKIAQEVLGRGNTFPLRNYPLVRTHTGVPGLKLDRLSNVLLIFVEALDRRYIGRTVDGIRLTPFLDRLRNDSLYMENFFANGAQTARGLFATFCSFYPRRGVSAMKTRYTHEYLCLPDVLKNAGYHTEMVISSQRDIDRLHLFLTRNGMQQVLDETDFPAGVERIGAASSLGKPDGALFDLLRDRLEELQRAPRPFLLATKTLTTHHPFHVPPGNPEVEALRANPDGYLAALRYLDLELERFFSRLQDQGLLRNTVVYILGDHGRHEHVGDTAVEKQVGHFLTPLFIWMDDSLRASAAYHPRTVSVVASQVDVTPTILAMNGLMPQVTSFLGQDVSCLLVRDCLQDNFAYLISPYGDEVVGLADQKGILLYGLRTKMLTHVDLGLGTTDITSSQTRSRIDDQYRHLQSLYLSSNALLDRNQVWSRKEIGLKR